MNPLLLNTNQGTSATSWQDRLYALTSKPAAASHAPIKPSVVYEASVPSASATYAGVGAASVDPSSNDALAALMARNSASSQPSGLFAGLGQALLGRFSTEGADFQADVAGAGSADASVSLAIRTASGATVKLSLNGTQSGLSVSLTSDRTLSDSEKQAVAGLASAFQDAVDGLGKQLPTLSLDGLMAADPAVLTSVDLNASIATAPGVHESIALHTGSDSRSLKVDGAGGSIALNLDMSQPATWGNRTQRDASVASYLDQIDAAARRGHADASLVSLFKDGFSQLNSHYPSTPASASTRSSVRNLSGNDHAMLTGLADFDVSISQATQAPNPRQGSELDTFNYDASQSTALSGRNASDRHITQSQQSHLKASFHTSPWPDVPLNLTDKIGSQNYNYTQIDDSAHASTNIAYAKGELVAATISQDASQDTHVMKYMVGQLIDDSDTPSHRDATRDLLPLLTQNARHPGTAEEQAMAADTLHAYTKLQADPSRIALHD
ncbi:hypothetical protein [Luteibacter aegosomatissinici]|uniref:hypothetical protein n=1 Tax=Luteibacter aegosomatissinici TaxID=2911539 RepID=UPI001FF8C966|nr:hypothetical protein [Luteibacter aegosomatissinici]UPG96039.1 hypothetical protein L2Y97_07995 [Luteibacter aegosomatissinici]